MTSADFNHTMDLNNPLLAAYVGAGGHLPLSDRAHAIAIISVTNTAGICSRKVFEQVEPSTKGSNRQRQRNESSHFSVHASAGRNRRLLAQDDIPRPPRLYTKLASWARSTIHITVIHELTSNPSLQNASLAFANSPSLQSCLAIGPFLGIARAPTSVVRGRAQKKCTLSRAGRCRVEREVSSFAACIKRFAGGDR